MNPLNINFMKSEENKTTKAYSAKINISIEQSLDKSGTKNIIEIEATKQDFMVMMGQAYEKSPQIKELLKESIEMHDMYQAALKKASGRKGPGIVIIGVNK